MSNFVHILQIVYNKPWLITMAGHAAICDLLEKKMTGTLVKRENGEDFCGNEVEVQQMEIMDGVAVIPVAGVLANRLSKYERGAGCVDYLDIQNDIEEANANKSVDCILLDFDSPGGTVTGIYECAAKIASSKKKVYSLVSGMCCSAAYWLASTSAKIYSMRSADVGSIGVYIPWVDRSRMLNAAGVDVTMFSSGKFKGMGYPGTSLTPEQSKFILDEVEDLASDFKLHVSENRPEISPSCMEGQSFMASKSKGFVDQFCTGLKDCLAKINNQQ